MTSMSAQVGWLLSTNFYNSPRAVFGMPTCHPLMHPLLFLTFLYKFHFFLHTSLIYILFESFAVVNEVMCICMCVCVCVCVFSGVMWKRRRKREKKLLDMKLLYLMLQTRIYQKLFILWTYMIICITSINDKYVLGISLINIEVWLESFLLILLLNFLINLLSSISLFIIKFT